MVTRLARVANLSVDNVSEDASAAGDMVASTVVRQFPPRESSRRRVSFESPEKVQSRDHANSKISRDLVDEQPLTQKHAIYTNEQNKLSRAYL